MSIETILEFGKIPWGMFFTDGMVVTSDVVFHITEYRIDPFEGRLLSTGARPAGDQRFVRTSRLNDGLLEEVADKLGAAIGASRAAVDAILVEVSKLASEVLSPLNKVGDEQGARLEADA